MVVQHIHYSGAVLRRVKKASSMYHRTIHSLTAWKIQIRISRRLWIYFSSIPTTKAIIISVLTYICVCLICSNSLSQCHIVHSQFCKVFHLRHQFSWFGCRPTVRSINTHTHTHPTIECHTTRRIHRTRIFGVMPVAERTPPYHTSILVSALNQLWTVDPNATKSIGYHYAELNSNREYTARVSARPPPPAKTKKMKSMYK